MLLGTEIDSSEQTFKEESMKISTEECGIVSKRCCGVAKDVACVMTANLAADCGTACCY